MTSRATGDIYEDLANRYLNQKGLSTIARNFHCKQGELDIIMKDGECIVFVEVRYRSASSFGSAADSVTRSKQKKLIHAANVFLSRHQLWHSDCRFDVITIDKDLNGKNNIQWHLNAFSSE